MYFLCCSRPLFKVANCDLKESYSSTVSWNIKSSRKRSEFPLAAKIPTPEGAGPACVVGALAPYNHGALLAGAARELDRLILVGAGHARDPNIDRGHGPLLPLSSSCILLLH